jgi:SAM-dependent methyltransferase
MLAMVGANKRVLEFGCASGYMSARLKDAGCHVTGVDVDAEALAEARLICDETFLVDLDVRSLADFLPETTYDVVIFGDVLEHLRDPWATLDSARRYIAPGGFAIVSIPNIAHGSIRLDLLRGNFEYSETGILDDTHLRFFTLRSAEDLCLRAGYEIEQIDRTKVALFADTPLTPVSRERLVDPALIEQIRRDPEHDTLQFVMRLRPLDDARKFDALAKELASLRERLHEAHLDLATSAQENQRLAIALRKLEMKNADLRTAHARCGEIEAANTKYRAATSAAISQFLAYAERELASVHARTFDLDAAIAAVHRSRIWALKRFLGKLRR